MSSRNPIRLLRTEARRVSSFAAAVIVGVAPGACAGVGPPLPPTPPPEAIPELEDRLAERPDDPETLLLLGAAHRGAGRPEDALPLLEQARALDPADPATHLMLGVVNEDLGRAAEAIAAYEAYLARTPDGSRTEALRGRVRLLRRAQLYQATREALAQEEELAEARPAPDRVAVFPFLIGAEDRALRPLSRALAAMLVTDLSQTGRLTVLERLNVQVLLDEMALTEEGLVDPETAARSGHLLGAGTVVQGRIGGSTDELDLEAALVAVSEAAPGEVRTVSASDVAGRLVDMEKRLAFDIYDEMGITLTTAERERVNQRPTESLQAILAYGQGLEATDRGAFREAADHFRRATGVDPGFDAARGAADEAEGLAEAEETSTDELASAAEVDEVFVPDPLARDPSAEVLGTERLGAGPAIFEVILRLPGGQR